MRNAQSSSFRLVTADPIPHRCTFLPPPSASTSIDLAAKVWPNRVSRLPKLLCPIFATLHLSNGDLVYDMFIFAQRRFYSRRPIHALLRSTDPQSLSTTRRRLIHVLYSAPFEDIASTHHPTRPNDSSRHPRTTPPVIHHRRHCVHGSCSLRAS